MCVRVCVHVASQVSVIARVHVAVLAHSASVAHGGHSFSPASFLEGRPLHGGRKSWKAQATARPVMQVLCRTRLLARSVIPHHYLVLDYCDSVYTFVLVRRVERGFSPRSPYSIHP